MKLLKVLLPVIVCVGGILYTLLMYAGSVETVNTIPRLILSLTVSVVCLLVFVLLVNRFVHQEDNRKAMSAIDLLLAFGMLLGVKLLFDRGMFFLLDFCKVSYQTKIIRDELNMIETINDLFSGLLFAPIFEEYLYRKVVMSIYKSKFGKLYGLLTCSVIFGLMHSGVTKWVCMVMGVLLSTIYWETRNIRIPILIHAAINGINTIALFVSRQIGEETVLSQAGSLVYCSNEILVGALMISMMALTMFMLKKRGILQ